MQPILPLPVIPELITRYGHDGATMLAVIAEIVGGWQGMAVVDEARLFGRATHLSPQAQSAVLASLSAYNLVSIEPRGSDLVRVELLPLFAANQPNPNDIAHLPSGNTTARQVQQSPPVSSPTPVYETSSRKEYKVPSSRRRDDELSRIFAAKEAEMTHKMTMSTDWQPSANIMKMLQNNCSISLAFAQGLRDEFVVYYMDKNRRETVGGWDQKFHKWVRREHTQQQSNVAGKQPSGSQNNEEARYLAKEKRRQLTEAVLDLRNTDW